MKTLIFSLFLGMFIQASAQQNDTIATSPATEANVRIENLQAQKKQVEEREKEALKAEVKKINKALEDGVITSEEATAKKRAAAEKRAKNIKDQQQIIDSNIALYERNKGERDAQSYTLGVEELEQKTDSTSAKSKFKNTYSELILGFGFSNTIGDGYSLGDQYKVAGSRYFEIGYQWSTGLSKDNFLRINYGLNFQFNGLKPKEDRYFVKNGNQAALEYYGEGLRKAKLRMDNMVIPVHFELGPTNTRGHAKKFRLGVGGYVGLNLNTIQKLKYREEGHRHKTKNHFNSQAEDFIYGLSAYVGYNTMALYVKYDLNPIFKYNEKAERIIAVGVRLAF